MRKALAICWLASVSSLARSRCGSRSRISLSSTGVSWRQGPHQAAQKSTTTGHVVGALHDVALEGGLGDVGDHALRVELRAALAKLSVESGGVTLAGEEAGEGIPVVLLHGLTATRRYVVMGSRALERDGHRVIAYDARGHGESTPAPDPDAYDYDDLVTDLAGGARRPRARAAPCWPAPRWAPTRRCGWRSTPPSASPAS